MRKTSLLFFLVTMGGYLLAQNPLERIYEYDAAGNRTCRKIISLSGEGGGKNLTVNPPDTTDSIEPEVYYLEEIGDISVQVYPNPVREKLYIQITNYPDFHSGEMSLYTADGKWLHNVIVNSNKTEIDLSKQVPGAYILKLQINGFYQEWKIIKQ